MNNDGFNYSGTPTVSISTSPNGNELANATAVAITTVRAGSQSVEKILLTNAGFGYTETPTITITGGGGSGAAATCLLEKSFNGVVRFVMTDNGIGFGTAPIVTVAQPGSGTTAVGIASIGNVGSFKQVNSIFIQDAGRGYSSAPIVTIANPETMSGIGTYQFNEVIQGMRSGTQARVKSWDYDTKILQISNVGVGTTTPGFFAGEDIKGLSSGALYSVTSYNKDDTTDKYNEGDIFESEADLLIDFSESNPFGSF